jgi:translocation and assembly module TamB
VTRRRASLLVALLLLAWAVWRLPLLSERALTAALSSFFNRPASVGEVRLHVFPLEAELLAVRVQGASPEALPLLEVARLVAAPSLMPLFGRRIVLARLDVERPVLRINAWEKGGDDLPRLASAGTGEGLELRIRRLSITAGEVVVNHERIPLEAELPDVSGRFGARRGGILLGNLSFKPGRLRFGTAPELPVGSDLALELDGPLVNVTEGHLRAEATDVAYRGMLDLRGKPRGRFTLNGKLDLGVLDRHVLLSGFGLTGSSHFEGTAEISVGELRLMGQLEGSGGLFKGVAVPRFAAAIERDGKGVRLHGLTLETLGGSARFDIDVASGTGPVRLKAELHELDAESAVRAIFDYGAFGLAASATGPVELSWPRGRSREVSGRMTLALATRQDERLPLSGRFEWRAERGVQFIEKAEFRTPRTGLRLAGRIEADNRTQLDVDGESSDLAEADLVGMGVRRALGTPAATSVGVSGSGSFRGRWKGSLRDPLFEGRFSGNDVAYLGVLWGSAEWAGSADADEIHSHSLVLRRPGGELWLDGRTETGALGGKDGLELRLRFKDWPAPDFTKALEWRTDLTGLLSGDATIAGRRSAPQGEAHLTAPEGRYFGTPYQDLDLHAALHGSSSEATSGRVLIGGGPVTFHGSLTQDAVYDATLEAKDVALDDILPPVAQGVRIGGRLSGEVRLQGALERPRLSGRFSSRRLFLGDEGLGSLELTLAGDGGGDIALQARCVSPRVDVTTEGRFAAAAPHEGTLTIAARDTSLDPFARVLAPGLPAGVGIVASGDVRLSGPLATPARLDAEALVSSLLVALPEYPVKNVEPLLIRVHDAEARLGEVRLSGEGTNLLVSGSAGLLPDGLLAVEAEGDADLQALSAVTRRLRGRGAARLALRASGTRATPHVEGTLEIEGAGVRFRGFPQGIDGVQGRVRFSEEAASFEALTGTVGGGGVELQGQAAYGEGRLRSFEVRGSGRGVRLRYPEGLKSAIDADVRLFGDAQAQWLSGSVEVKEARWTRRYDVASEILATRAPREAQASLGSSLHYDVKLSAPGTLLVDNNLATLSARALLTLQGTYEAPVLLGRAQIDRGRVYFQGNTYVIRRGSVDFTNPQEIDPLFNIEAEARVRSYRVTLKVNGTLERVYPTLTSDPPLSAVQILNLLAGADESAVANLAQSQVDQTRLAATGAATLAAGKLSEEVGLERGAEKLLGLNRFSIDPSIVRSGVTDPTARLTLGKRVTSDVNVLYSVDLRGTDERLLSVEYTLSDRLSVLLTRTEPGGFGFDVRLRHAR